MTIAKTSRILIVRSWNLRNLKASGAHFLEHVVSGTRLPLASISLTTHSISMRRRGPLASVRRILCRHASPPLPLPPGWRRELGAAGKPRLIDQRAEYCLDFVSILFILGPLPSPARKTTHSRTGYWIQRVERERVRLYTTRTRSPVGNF